MAAAPELGRATQIEPFAPPARSRLAADLFEEYSRRIYTYCLRQLRSPEEAEDAVQATYLSACRHLMRGFEPNTAQAWLLKVAENECLTRLRSQSRRAHLESGHDVEMIEETVAARDHQGDELFGIEDALAGLPEQQRRAILLREWQGLSYREVAAELDISQSAVETLIFRARRSLAAALETTTDVPEPAPARRRLFHAFDLGAILAGFKASLAGNLSMNVATSVAVAASTATIVSGPIDRAHVRPLLEKEPKVQAMPLSSPSAGAERASVARPWKVAPAKGKPAKGGKALGHGQGHGKGHLKANGKPPGHSKAHGGNGRGHGHGHGGGKGRK
jgi:RNA polymerase sigma factor (sigma-70 family)